MRRVTFAFFGHFLISTFAIFSPQFVIFADQCDFFLPYSILFSSFAILAFRPELLFSPSTISAFPVRYSLSSPYYSFVLSIITIKLLSSRSNVAVLLPLSSVPYSPSAIFIFIGGSVRHFCSPPAMFTFSTAILHVFPPLISYFPSATCVSIRHFPLHIRNKYLCTTIWPPLKSSASGRAFRSRRIISCSRHLSIAIRRLVNWHLSQDFPQAAFSIVSGRQFRRLLASATHNSITLLSIQ